METCNYTCQRILKCQCGEFLCSHKMITHMNLGHSASPMPGIELVSSFSNVFSLISEYKQSIIERGRCLTERLNNLISYQITQLESFEAKASRTDFSKLTESSCEEVFRGLAVIKQSHDNDLDQMQELLFKMNALIVSGGLDTAARVWKNESEILAVKDHASSVRSVAVAHSKEFFITGSDDKTLKVWDMATGKQMLVLEGHSDKVNSVVINNNDQFAASASSDKTIRVWNLLNGVQIQALKGHTEFIVALAISSDNNFIVSGSWDKTVRVWNGQEVQVLQGHHSWVTSVAISSSNTAVVSASYDGTVRIWEKRVRVLEGHTDIVNSVAICRNDELIVSGSKDKTVRLWTLEHGVQAQVLQCEGDVLSVNLLGGYVFFGVSCKDYLIKAWNLETDKKVSVLRKKNIWVYSVNLILS